MPAPADILTTLDYGPSPEDTGPVQDWLAAHGDGFGHFIGGGFTAPAALFEVVNPATGAPLARVSQGGPAEVAAAVRAARAAQPGWAGLDPHDRVRHLVAGLQRLDVFGRRMDRCARSLAGLLRRRTFFHPWCRTRLGLLRAGLPRSEPAQRKGKRQGKCGNVG